MLKQFQKNLKKSPTAAENKLWHHLRNRRFYGFKFRRQVCIENYIVDFICHEKNLIIEVDGSQHQEQMDYDQVRTEVLIKRGYRVLRFWNNEILGQIDMVLEAIYQQLNIE